MKRKTYDNDNIYLPKIFLLQLQLEEHSESEDALKSKNWKLLSWLLINSNFMVPDRVHEEFQIVLLQVSNLTKGEIP